MQKNILKILGFFAIGMLGGIFADQIIWPYFVERPLFEYYNLEQPIYVTEKKEIYIQENNALEDAIERARDSLIGIRSKTESQKYIEGAGLAVTSDGLVVTFSELVPKGSEFSFYVNGKAVSYQILKRDPESGLALIKLEKSNLHVLGFAESEKIKLGQRVFLIGAIFASSSPEVIVDEGIIRKISGEYIETNIVETDGTEGSVLFDIEAKVIGLNKIDNMGKIITVPASTIKRFIGF
jgi:S1-C subfamily serine protease